MSLLDIGFVQNSYTEIKEKELFGKWVTLKDIRPLYDNLDESISKEIIGQSEQGRYIFKLKLRTGYLSLNSCIFQPKISNRAMVTFYLYLFYLIHAS